MTEKDLIKTAKAAAKMSYSPYSNCRVGAALLCVNGMVYTGCNIENVSYGLTMCAERTAIYKMVSSGCTKFVAIAVSAGEKPTDSAPCGACRQVISEFCEDINETPIIECGQNGTYYMEPVISFYPRPFMKFEPNND